MKTQYLTCNTLRHARTARMFLSWPTFLVVSTVYDSLDIAVRSLAPLAQYKRRSVVARYHCPSVSKLRFILLAKIP